VGSWNSAPRWTRTSNLPRFLADALPWWTRATSELSGQKEARANSPPVEQNTSAASPFRFHFLRIKLSKNEQEAKVSSVGSPFVGLLSRKLEKRPCKEKSLGFLTEAW